MRLCHYILAPALFIVILMGCSRGRDQQSVFQSGRGFCSNLKLGEFSLELRRSTKYRGYFDLIISVNEALNPGQTVHILLANQNLDYVELPPNGGLIRGRLLFNGPISYDEVVAYPLLVIAPRKGNSGSPLQSLSEDDEAVCQLPRTDNSGTGSSGATIQ